MTCMAAGMNDQAVKPNPVSFPRTPRSIVLCYRPNASPTQKCAQDWRNSLYRAACKARRSLSEILIIAFTSSFQVENPRTGSCVEE